MTPRWFTLLVATLEVWWEYFCIALLGTGGALFATILIDAIVMALLL